MEADPTDSTRDWLLPEHSRPPLIRELEQRVEEALATARASEAAVMSVGAAAIDAAEQARRAAELAERASAAAVEARGKGPTPRPPSAAKPTAGGADLGDFGERADRLVARLRQLQRIPLGSSPAGDDILASSFPPETEQEKWL